MIIYGECMSVPFTWRGNDRDNTLVCIRTGPPTLFDSWKRCFGNLFPFHWFLRQNIVPPPYNKFQHWVRRLGLSSHLLSELRFSNPLQGWKDDFDRWIFQPVSLLFRFIQPILCTLSARAIIESIHPSRTIRSDTRPLTFKHQVLSSLFWIWCSKGHIPDNLHKPSLTSKENGIPACVLASEWRNEMSSDFRPIIVSAEVFESADGKIRVLSEVSSTKIS